MPLLALDDLELRPEEPWLEVPEQAPVPARGPVLLGLARLAEAAARDGPTGIRLEPDEDPAALAPVLDRLSLIALRFAFPHDGRPYSQAAVLRRRLHFGGELRAVGATLFDLVPHLEQAGFDSVALASLPADWRRHLERLRLPRLYAPAARASIWRARAAAGARGGGGRP